MLRILLVCLLLAAPLAARAGTIVVTMNSATDCPSPTSCTATFEDSDANITIILQAHAAQCQAANNGVACNVSQQARFAALAMVEIMTGFVNDYQKQQATKVTPYVPVNPTPAGAKIPGAK